MPSEAKLIKLANQLVRQTVEGNISWQRDALPSSLVNGTSQIIRRYCITEYKGQSLAVFERRVYGYDPDRDDHAWKGFACIAILEGGDIAWENSEDISQLWTLLRVANESAAGIDDVIDSLLD